MGEVFNAELYAGQKSGIMATLEREAAAMSTADKAQLATDVVGLFDPTPTSGIASTAISAFRGDAWGVGLGLLGLVPYLGNAGKLAKIASLAPKTAAALGKFMKAGDDLAKAGKTVLEQMFSKAQVIAARRKAAQAVQDAMKKKRIDPNCKECMKVRNSRLPQKGGKWDTPDGKPPTSGSGKFTFDEPKTLPDGRKVESIQYKDGFPDFDPYVQGGKHDIWAVTGDAGKDAKALERELGVARPGPNADWTLHHFEDGQVGWVPSIIHNTPEGGVAHTGGASIVSNDLY
jgi:hypothetical protein